MILALAGQFKQLSHEPEKFRDQGYHLYLLSVLELGFVTVRLFHLTVQHQTHFVLKIRNEN